MNGSQSPDIIPVSSAYAMARGPDRQLRNLVHATRDMFACMASDRHYVNATADINVSTPAEDLSHTQPPPLSSLDARRRRTRHGAGSRAADSRASETNFLRMTRSQHTRLYRHNAAQFHRVHLNTKAVKYLRIVTNIKTGFEYYNLVCFFSYFPEQQSPSIRTKPTVVYYCTVMEN